MSVPQTRCKQCAAWVALFPGVAAGTVVCDTCLAAMGALPVPSAAAPPRRMHGRDFAIACFILAVAWLAMVAWLAIAPPNG